MKRNLRDAARVFTGQVSAGLSLLGDRSRGEFGILVYHRVAERTIGVPEPSINVTPEAFREQLSGMLALDYQFWSLDQVLEAHAKRDAIPSRVAVVTFDDGYECVYSQAFPILRELEIPATVFVNTAFLGQEDAFPFDSWGIANSNCTPSESYCPLTWAQCREMHESSLIEIGAHTHTHEDFRGRAEDFKKDLCVCVDQLRHNLPRTNVSFAFPFGRWHLGYVSDELMSAARECDVTCALTTECQLIRPVTDPFGWGRFNVYDWDTPATISARLRGWYAWAPFWQERFSSLAKRFVPRRGAAV